ncbi:MAG: polyribonucleotide nucleotidyltransferase [Patescibacteria group bacterium]
MKKQIFELPLAGKTLIVEHTDLTSQAGGSVMVKLGETVVLATAVMSDHTQPALPYFPLSVEFEEKFYAAGAIMGSRFSRREGKPSDEAVLSARLIDRTIRPLFPSHLRHDVQVVITVLALGEDDPDILGIIGASLALGISDIPWGGPVGAVRISRNKVTGALYINPTYIERPVGAMEFEVVACGLEGTINMIEVSGDEVQEGDVLAVLEGAINFHAVLEVFQKNIISQIGKPKRRITATAIAPAVEELYASQFSHRLWETVFSKQSGKNHIVALGKEFITAVAALDATLSPVHSKDYFDEKINDVLHSGAASGLRADGRALDEVRPLHAQAGGISPVLHGSGIFYRGETHVFSALTLGGPDSAQIIDSVEDKNFSKRFMHHYNFPPYSVGETGRVGGFNRRMIGHGALAEKALVPLLPAQADFPYTIRLVSETMSSNGSSSMASVCASSLALFDGGVPMKCHVAGIASGVMMGESSYVLLTDIQGPEDEHGDMDFKVAGTSEGITAIQMDVKVKGVSIEILHGALEKARLARLQILETLVATIPMPQSQISPRAPHITMVHILPEQIGLVIGGGGKTINKIKDESGVDEITIEDSGIVYITGTNIATQTAAAIITAMTKVYAVGDIVEVEITKITAFGAFARLDTYHEGLIHISEVIPERLESLEGILKPGDKVMVAVVKIDEGKIGLSIKKINPHFLATNASSSL